MPYNTKTIPMVGKLITTVDPSQIQDNFQKVENLRYDPLMKGIKGMTKINATPLADLEVKAGMQFRKVDPQVESHTIVQAHTGSTSKVYDNPTAIPNTGNFTAIHTDASGAGTGRFDITPVESSVYCNGEETLIWSGDKANIGSFLIASTDATKADFITLNRANYTNHTQKIRNRVTLDVATLPDSAETQVFIGSTQKIKAINFTVEAGSPDRYTTPDVQYYDGSAWTSVTTLADTTVVGGFTLKQSGSYTFDDTQTVAKAVILDGIQLFWYRITFGVYVTIAGTINLSHVDLSANIQPLEDLWDGGDIPLALLRRDEGNDVVNITENNYDTNNNATWVSLKGSLSGNSVDLPDNITTATGIDTASFGNVYVLSDAEFKVYLLDADGDIISEIDISSFYTDLPTDGTPIGVRSINESIPSGSSTRSTLTPSILVTGTKKILKISAKGKFIAEYNNITYDASAGNSVGIAQFKSGTEHFWIVDETTSKLYSMDVNFTLVNTYTLPFIPSDIVVRNYNNLPKLLISERDNAVVRVYDFSGASISSITLPNKVLGMSTNRVLYDPTDLGTGKPVISRLEGRLDTTTISLSYTNKRLLVGSFNRLSGIRINFIPCNTNTGADPSLVKVTGNSNTSISQVALSGVIDRTRSDDFEIPFNQSGTITWNPLSEADEVKVSVEGLSLYTYEITLDAFLLADIKAYYIAGVPAQKVIHPYSFPVNAHDRLWLCDQTKDKRNSINVSAQFTDSVFNGRDSIELSIGDSLPIVSASPVQGGMIVCKHSETWFIQGDTPANFRVKNISREIGCSSPLTMKSVNLKAGNGSLSQIAAWMDTDGVYMSDGVSINKISFDIEGLFDPSNSTRLNPIGISSAFFDVSRNEYHLLYPEIGSATINKEIVFDINNKVWYNINRGSSKSLQSGFKTIDSKGDYYTYGCDSAGTVYRLENGTDFDGNSIVHVIKTGDIRLTGENTLHTLIRRVNLVQKAKNVTPNKVQVTHFGDTSSIGTSFILPVADPTHRIKTSRGDINTGVHMYHSIELSMTTDNEVEGFEPLELVLFYTSARKEK